MAKKNPQQWYVGYEYESPGKPENVGYGLYTGQTRTDVYNVVLKTVNALGPGYRLTRITTSYEADA